MFPPRVVLSAVDFSDSSRVALTFAARLAAQSSGALHVLHVEDPLLAAAARGQGLDLTRDTRDELEIFARSAAPAASRAPQLHVAVGSAAKVVCDVAMRENADLVVVGMRGISAIEHVVFGSTTETILRGATIPVFAVPDAWKPPHPESDDLRGLGPVVAAIEPTDESLAAAGAAARLAQLLHTRIEAIHVVPSLRVLNRWQTHANAIVQERERAARAELEGALHRLGTAAPYELRIESGNVAQWVAEAVSPAGGRHPVLVLGRRREGAGATAYRILTLANAPVLQWTETTGAGVDRPRARRR